MKPEPSEVPRRFCSSPPRLSKNSLNSSSNGEPGGSCGMSRSLGPCWGTFWVVVMFTTVGINLSTSSAKLSGALRVGCATAGCASARPNETAAATATDLKTPGKSVRITSDLQRRSGLNGSERPAPRVRVPVYMEPDCGANKEALMLLIVSVFPRPLRNSTGGVAGLPQRRRYGFAVGFPALLLGRRRSGRVVEIAEEVGVRA